MDELTNKIWQMMDLLMVRNAGVFSNLNSLIGLLKAVRCSIGASKSPKGSSPKMHKLKEGDLSSGQVINLVKL